MRKFSVFFLLLLLFIVSSCKHEAPQHASQKQEKPDSNALRIAVLPTSDCFPFFYAADKGIYDSLHLDVQLVSYGSQLDCDTALAGGSIDGSVTDLIRARMMDYHRRPHLSVVMATEGRWMLVASREVRMKKLSQLRDRTIAVSRFSVTDFLSDTYCVKGGLAEDAAYRPQINNISLRMKMLNEKQVETAVLPEPQAALAVTFGNRIIKGTSSEAMTMGCLAVRTSVLTEKKKQEQLALFIKGYNLAVKRLNAHKREQLDTLFVQHGYVFDIKQAKAIQLPTFRSAFLPQTADMARAKAFLTKRGKVPAGFAGPPINGRFIK